MDNQSTQETVTPSQRANDQASGNAAHPARLDQEKPSFVKLAMRNMVKKGSTSLFHFFLTVVGVVGALLGLAIAFH
ncbi:MAG: DUF3285 domain-containing protein [Pseudanabaenaceae cyanobacterium bins.39]|nr:DUF3285 domain-containing protein [Pseudanabaenaceae cyanobacterium bins.39]